MLQTEEMHYLQQHFRLTQKSSMDHLETVKALDLFEPKKCESYLNHLTKVLDFPSLQVAASQLSKRYAYMVVLPVLFSMSVWNKGLMMKADHCFIEPDWKADRWMPRLRLESGLTSNIEGEREVWRDRLIQELFAENITRVWHTLTLVTRVPLSTLWENTAIYIFWLYEEKIKDFDNHTRQRANADLQYLIHAASPRLFGEAQNPLKKFDSPKTYVIDEDSYIRIRQTCCLYYQTHILGTCCKSCPRKVKKNKAIPQI
ncbi:IucA/IucC family C-terminal-domain containing protein [Thermoflavimicrobium daqui]|uniref:Aerobactin siderophore biosynthesis IucA/IucC-like C-terminal domain-containing protein n=1 Tax=Thermoflavimicrobium daqui TaxID=2137476 RepID=A0A364K9V7_9BACL|nr:IucA/IucC family C-terminal-domain containing protein [Thermoflavimicrobium daqui]RAL27086.1 hypothetical protein DL897_03370 [Thermoflavimicrobium daqui]